MLLQYTDDPDVIAAASELVLVTIFSCRTVVDGWTNCLRGILNGCALQSVNAKTSLTCAWCVGIPSAYALCFVAGLRLRGLWLGLVIQNTASAVILTCVMVRQDWEELSRRAQERSAGKKGAEPTRSETRRLTGSAGSDEEED